MEVESLNINDVATQFKNEIENFKNTKVKCGIIGRSGTGKSSLINAIVGEEVSAVGETETTMEISKPIEHNGLIFYDLPGSSTINFPLDTYVEKMGVKNFDCVILVTSDRFYEDDLKLIDQILEQKVPIFTVRTKIDFSVDRALRRDISEVETCDSIRQDLINNLKSYRINGIYLTSADFPAKYDLPKLISDISNNLSELKKQRFIADVSALSENIIAEKRKLSEKLISKYSVVSAINGLNPIPGLDVGVDIGILSKLSVEIQKIYGLDNAQVSYASTLISGKNKAILVARALNFTSKFIGKEAILILLKKVGLSVASKSFSKWIPFVGSAIAAGIGYKLTSSFGEDMLDEAESIAIETFHNLRSEH